MAIAAAFLAAGCGSSGRCKQGDSCVPANPCHLGTLACQGSGSTCQDIDQSQPNGTACGDGGSCVAGSCADATGCSVSIQDCGPTAANTCIATDPNNCGGCGAVCLTAQCREGVCTGCRPGFAEDCPNDQDMCMDGDCDSLCAFGLGSGTQVSCGLDGLCTPLEASDPPRVNIGLCKLPGDSTEPGLGEACDGGCRDGLACLTSPSTGTFACTSVCDPFLAASCPSGFGCDPIFDALQFYVGYGYCFPIANGALDVGQICSGNEPCRAGTTCVLGGLSDGGLGCAPWCDPMADGGCGPDGCVPFTTDNEAYAGIGGCVDVPFGTLGKNQICEFQGCALPYTCTTMIDGEDACLELCNPWHPACSGGDSCLPVFGVKDNDYKNYGVCFPEPGNPQPEFGPCNSDVNNCAPNLYCLAEGGNSSVCIQYCDPFDPTTCPDQQWCFALSDPQGQFASAGVCNGVTGSKHSGEACGIGDCVSGDCYYRGPRDSAGICIQACELGTVTSCPGGACVDGGFGNGLGLCVLADGGRWD